MQFLALLALCVALPFTAWGQQSGLTVADGLEMEIIDSAGWTSWAPDIPSVSPDGTKTFIVTRQGDVRAGLDRYRLYVYEVAAEAGPVRQRLLTSLESKTNEPGIGSVQWIDNDHLAFLGTSGTALAQVFAVASSSGVVSQRTHHAKGVKAYSINRRGDVLFLSNPEPDPKILSDAIQSGFVVEINNPFLLVGEDWPRALPNERNRLFVVKGEAQPREIGSCHLSVAGARYPRFWISPDGELAVMRDFTTNIPESWDRYEDPVMKHRFAQIREGQRMGRSSHVDNWAIMNLCSLELDTYEPLTNTPASIFSAALWLPDSKSVVVTHLMLPLTGKVEDLIVARRQHTISEVSIATRQALPLTFMTDGGVTALTWDQQRELLTVSSFTYLKAPQPPREFARSGNAWRLVTERKDLGVKVTALLRGRVGARVVEDVNTPREFEIFRVETQAVLLRTDLNPRLRSIDIGRARSYSWRDEDGDEWRGAILLPPGFTSERRYPLIIQTHGSQPDNFLLDGIAMAPGQSARALAAKGFVVVQEPERGVKIPYGTKEEGRKLVKSYRALVGKLANEGLVDRERVGIIGWSRTDYHVKYLLAHGDVPIAAAAVHDGLSLGYIGLVFSSHFARSFALYQGVYGPIPGAGLETLFKEAPPLNAHRMRTPLRMEIMANGNGGIALSFELYSWLRLYGIPTELTIYPRGLHAPQKVGERYRSQQTNIDWFCFWILGEEDRDPAKADQYRRWRAMKTAWHAQGRKAVPQSVRVTGESGH